MSKKENEKPINKKESTTSKKFFYIFISILSTVMIIMATVSFIYGEPKYIISNGIIFVFALIAILLVFDSIDSLNVVNVLSLKTKVKDKEKEIDKLNTENIQLRNQIISVMNTTFNKQNVYVGYPKDFVVKEADKTDAEEEENYSQSSNPNTAEEQHRSRYNYRLLNSEIDKFLLNRFQQDNNIGEVNLHKDIKIANIGVASDPIIDKDIIYDAYVRRPMDEIFIEISSGLSLSPIFDFKLYFMISRVLYYSQSNKVKAKMMLLIPKFSETYINDHLDQFRHNRANRLTQRLREMYAPAIQNDLFEIVEIEITDDEMKQIENISSV